MNDDAKGATALGIYTQFDEFVRLAKAEMDEYHRLLAEKDFDKAFECLARARHRLMNAHYVAQRPRESSDD